MSGEPVSGEPVSEPPSAGLPATDPRPASGSAASGRQNPGAGRQHPELSTFERTAIRDFNDLSHEWRRLFAEFLGTFMLVVVAAGGSVVNAATNGGVGRGAEVAAPPLTVIAIILFMGAISGAHLNPVVTIAFALRTDFQWRRAPGYIVAQFVGGTAASFALLGIFGSRGDNGQTLPGPGFTDLQSFAVETLLTFGLVSVILGAASGAQNIGPLSAFAAGAFIAGAGLWAGPVSGASMNPARSLGPALVSGDVAHLWVYFAGPLLGALLAVAVAHLLRGRGGGAFAKIAAQGTPD